MALAAGLSAGLTTALVPTAGAQQAAFDRTRPPALGPAPALTVPTVKRGRLENGVSLRVVEHRELPLVQVTLLVAGGGRLDGNDRVLATFVANMLDEGAGKRDAKPACAGRLRLGTDNRDLLTDKGVHQC